MDTKKLRQKVLDLAIRGKLVPQDPTDEPASVLLERIQAEKQKLIAEGKIKKEKRTSFIFKGEDNSYYEKVLEKGKETVENITDEIPFDIPSNWTWTRLGAIGEIIAGGTPDSKNKTFWDGQISWITPADLTGYKDMYISSGRRNITELGLQKSSATYIKKNSILFSSRAPIGYIVIANNMLTTNQGFKTISPIEERMSKYIYYTLKALTPIIKLHASGTTFKEISATTFSTTLFPLSPQKEQKRIVEAIENLTNNISSIDEEYSLIEEKISLAKSKLLDIAIRGKLLPQNKDDEPASELLERIRKEKESAQTTSKGKRKTADSYIFKGEDNLYYEKIGTETTCIQDEIPFDIPLNWTWCRLGDLCLLAFSGKSPSYVKQDNKHYVLGQKNNQAYGIDLNGIKFCSDDFWYNYPPEFYLKRNDILLNTLGTGTVGRVGIFDIDSNDRYITDGHLFVFRNMFIETAYFMYYTLLCFRNFIEKEADGTTNQKFLKLNSVLRYLIPLPPLEEQKRIVDFITRANEQLDSILNK